MDTATWACVQGDWDQYKGQVKQRWGKLTDDDLMHIAGDRESLAAALQRRYGLARDRVEAEIEEFAGRADAATDQSWTAKAKQKLSAFGAKAKHYYQQHRIGDMVGDVENTMRKHPIPSMAVGLGVGFLLGTLLSLVQRRTHVHAD